MTHPPISARRALVGSMLRRYRENLGYSLDDAARVLGRDRSTISRFETGQRGIRPEALRVLLTEYGVDESVREALAAITRLRGPGTWWNDHREALGHGYVDFVAAEAAASQVSVYAPLQVPDLLRTEAYAMAAAGADPAVPGDGGRLAAEAAMVRQAAVLKERRADYTVILGEAALIQQVGGERVLRGQLAHLADLASAHPWLGIRILPFTADAHAAGSGGFSVLRFTGVPDLGLAHVAGPGGGMCLGDAAVGGYIKVFTRLSCFSLSPERSAERLRRLAGR